MTVASAVLREYERAYGPFVHMSQEEKSVWLRFLQQGGTMYAPFAYDVRVGAGLQMPPDASSYELKSAYALTTKRIDVVCSVQGIPWIIEVKTRAGLGVIGQLIGYRDLWLADNPLHDRAEMLLVCDALQPDLAGILEQQGIRYVVVNP